MMTPTPQRIENPEKTAFAEVVPARGGILTRWHLEGQDMLYLDEARFANPSLSVRGGIPILFPICGNLPDNTYTYAGQSFTLKQHGFARDLPWTILQQGSNFLELVLDSTPYTLSLYPFEFQFRLTYQLEGKALSLRSHLTNHSPQPMPFSLGFHPYFAVTDKNTLTFDLPASQQLDHLTRQISPFTGTLDLSQPELDRALFPVTAQQATLSGQQTLTMTYDAVFTTLVVWSLLDKPYVCLEPWTAQRNALNTGIDLIYLDPGSTFKATVQFRVEPATSAMHGSAG